MKNRILYKFFSMMECRKQEFLSNFYYNNLVVKLKKVPRGLTLYGKIEVIFPQGLILGDNVHIGNNAYLNCRGGLLIGDHCHIGRNVTITSTQPNYESSVIPFDSTYVPGRILIGKGVHIGMNVSIMAGVSIGDGAIIGSGSIITKNVEKGAIIGTPDQCQEKTRDMSAFLNNYEERRFSGEGGVELDNEVYKNNKPLISNSFKVRDKPVFILSTGRAGSKSIAAFLNKYKEIEAYHELFYDFFKVLSTNYLSGKISRESVKEEILKLYSSIDNFNSQRIFIDSDQKLAPFVDILQEIFPNAKFIWLIRKPDGFLSSARARGWYQNDAPVFNKDTVLIQKEHYSHGTRITGDTLKNSEQVKDWESYSTDDKILWYWYYWNNLIKSQLENIPDDQKLVIKLEELSLRKNELISFIGVKSKDSYDLKKNNKVKRKHKKHYSAKINSDKIYSCLNFYNEINSCNTESLNRS